MTSITQDGHSLWTFTRTLTKLLKDWIITTVWCQCPECRSLGSPFLKDAPLSMECTFKKRFYHKCCQAEIPAPWTLTECQHGAPSWVTRLGVEESKDGFYRGDSWMDTILLVETHYNTTRYDEMLYNIYREITADAMEKETWIALMKQPNPVKLRCIKMFNCFDPRTIYDRMTFASLLDIIITYVGRACDCTKCFQFSTAHKRRSCKTFSWLYNMMGTLKMPIPNPKYHHPSLYTKGTPLIRCLGGTEATLVPSATIMYDVALREGWMLDIYSALKGTGAEGHFLKQLALHANMPVFLMRVIAHHCVYVNMMDESFSVYKYDCYELIKNIVPERNVMKFYALD
jgi:hypothetical protein